MRRRTAIRLSFFLSLCILAITLLFAHPPTERAGRVIQSPIELWIGHELENIANHFINPTLHYSALTYQSPKTVIVHDLTLTAPDTLDPTKHIDILSVKTARIELAQIPHLGQSLKIKEFDLDTPVVRLVATQPVHFPTAGSATQPDGNSATTQPHKTHFVGFSGFLKKKHTPGSPRRKPSDFFQITKIDIKNGTLLYDARHKDLQPFTLDGLTSTLNVNPNPPTAPGATATEPGQSTNGWYVLDCKAAREPIFSAEMQGRLNVNTGALEFSPLTARLALSRETHDKLPPNIQRVVDRYQARGNLQCVLTGLLMLKDKMKTKLLTHLELTDAHARIGRTDLPIQKLTAELRTENLLTRAKSFHAEILNGTVDAEGSLPFKRGQTISLHVQINNVGLARTIRTLSTGPAAGAPDTPPKIAGRVSGEISYSAPVAHWNTQMSGTGHLVLDHGRIPDLPLLGDIFNGIRALGKSVGLNNGKPDDHAEIYFLFQGDRLDVLGLDAHSTTMGMRAAGTVDRTGHVDLQVNAGPLERIEQLLGPIGAAMSKLTDNVAKYHVTGKSGHLTINFEVGPQ
ncbi:MAG: hypothetical protein ACTHN5_18470 [Phycisphaerae bacterium]